MKKIKTTAHLTILGLILACNPTNSWADNSNSYSNTERAMMKSEQKDANKLLQQATNFYKSLHNAEKQVPASILRNAGCIVVFPSVTTAAVIVGGSHGDGIASCKMSNNKWSDVAFVDLNSASFGAQLGGKESSIVLYLTDSTAIRALKQGKFELGADASVVAGDFDRSVETPHKGVIAYAQSSGAFLGASITGGKVSQDPESNESFYGRKADISTILEGRSMEMDKGSDEFTRVLP